MITADCREREEPDLATLLTEHKNGRIEGSYKTIIERAACFEH